MKEQVLDSCAQLRSNGNPANLTSAEAMAWTLQVAYCKLASKFEMQDRIDVAEIAMRRAKMFYGSNSDFTSAEIKIADYIQKTPLKISRP